MPEEFFHGQNFTLVVCDEYRTCARCGHSTRLLVNAGPGTGCFECEPLLAFRSYRETVRVSNQSDCVLSASVKRIPNFSAMDKPIILVSLEPAEHQLEIQIGGVSEFEV